MDHQFGRGFEARSDAKIKIIRKRNKGVKDIVGKFVREEFEKMKYPENDNVV